MTGSPRRNRVDPWGDLHAVPERGLFTGNRGCLVDDDGELRRHHRGSLWIICLTSFRDWRHPLDSPRTWTPLFFLDDAVALAAGHRPCGLCRRNDYLDYRAAVADADAESRPVLATELNRRLQAERLERPSGRGRGPWLDRAPDRIVWSAPIASLPAGTVVLDEDGGPQLLTARARQPFTFAGWGPPSSRPSAGTTSVLTPPTSVAALRGGFRPHLHRTAAERRSS